jgi:hypothetical protein
MPHKKTFVVTMDREIKKRVNVQSGVVGCTPNGMSSGERCGRLRAKSKDQLCSR